MGFLAYRVEQVGQEFNAAWEQQEEQALKDGQVRIAVHYSSVNYKDMLSANGNKGVTKTYPHTPGIDVAGIVIESQSAAFNKGDEVLAFGFDLGMNTDGGFAEQVVLPDAWVLKKPANISLKELMAWGTAGFTAALSVEKLLKNGMRPDNGAVLVTGATGGVGSVALALLAKLGFSVIAMTGKSEQSHFLKQLGATQIIGRTEVLAFKGKSMAKPLYQAAIDTTGGDLVSAIIPQLQHGGAITTCAMIAGLSIEASVFPFILRGVSLLGVDSVEISQQEKQAIVDKIAGAWALSDIETLVTEIACAQLPGVLDKLKAGQAIGRYRLNLLS